MKFRFKMFRMHLAASATVLTLVLGALYLGWYHWPGWYLAVVTRVVVVMACVDVALGPALTLVIANPAKERRTLARDLAVIIAVQLLALGYGSVQLWKGRPLYYAFSGDILQLVQAYDLDPTEVQLARDENPDFAPHWYSLPRWIWAPEPIQAAGAAAAATATRPDYSTMPRYYRSWGAGKAELRRKLRPVDAWNFFIFNEKDALKARMRADGLHPDERNSIPMTGRGRPLLVVFEPETLKILAIIKPR
ncbi:MAG: hypothetical protein ACHQIL_12460 [Steroidobacterales bacterium]